jgi:hypothetical protein
LSFGQKSIDKKLPELKAEILNEKVDSSDNTDCVWFSHAKLLINELISSKNSKKKLKRD